MDQAIIGGAEAIGFCAVVGSLTDLRQTHRLTMPYRDCAALQDWQERVEQHSPRLGSISGAVGQLFHGDLNQRGCFQRHLALNATGFNADRDVIGAEGEAWSCAPSCPAAVRDWMPRDFSSRREDD